jgi:hypothetical protein
MEERTKKKPNNHPIKPHLSPRPTFLQGKTLKGTKKEVIP